MDCAPFLRPRVKYNLRKEETTVAIIRRKFAREFELAAIEQVGSGKSLARVASEMDVRENTLQLWKHEQGRAA